MTMKKPRSTFFLHNRALLHRTETEHPNAALAVILAVSGTETPVPELHIVIDGQMSSKVAAGLLVSGLMQIVADGNVPLTIVQDFIRPLFPHGVVEYGH
jgi:hypothetical protein